MHFFPEKRNKDFYFYGRGVFQITVVAAPRGEIRNGISGVWHKRERRRRDGFGLSTTDL